MSNQATITRRETLLAVTTLAAATALFAMSATAQAQKPGTIEAFLADYPRQITNDHLHQRLKDDASKVNTWFFEQGRLVRAGEDFLVAMNNDTFYKMGYADNRVSPVVVRVQNPKKDRFVSIQINDQRDFNVAAIMDADGPYVLVKENQTPPIGARPVRVTDDFNLVMIRVEVRSEADAPAALAVYNTAAIEGRSGGPLPKLDLLSKYRPEVRARALEMMEQWVRSLSHTDWLFGRPEERGIRVSDLDRAAGTLHNEGGPVREHSMYSSVYTDASGQTMKGANGTYVLTMAAPPVDAFWSVTVYRVTDRGGYFYPNPLNRYSINNTGAVPSADSTYTFTFKLECAESDRNCIPVPPGPWGLAGRFYRPRAEVLEHKWEMPKPALQK